MTSPQFWLRITSLLLAWCAASLASAVDGNAEIRAGSMVLIRHALAPGVGDPEHFTLNDCSTQRNLSAEGRAQAVRLGQFFRKLPVPVDAVWSSQWCRARDTADLAFPGLRVDKPAFNSFFGEPDSAPAQTQAAKALMNAWAGKGVLVVVTHQVNITAIAGVVPASGEAVVLGRRDGVWSVTGRFSP
ncbi:histidine phosphatase family protein [Rhodoferax mekongensis]|uniref:histidine phosphatase family protein n=1 Tax=Rhodoferax mekongensis TaxID=3068341 RepID=UPI0028BE3DDE|nr:histidine phosphatase family protein [Rhodoferax sp. TBRC 17199]MDT7516842.1 histidine phosphatase family protein [Rhodoferax sp. TBRC 17199]